MFAFYYHITGVFSSQLGSSLLWDHLQHYFFLLFYLVLYPLPNTVPIHGIICYTLFLTHKTVNVDSMITKFHCLPHPFCASLYTKLHLFIVSDLSWQTLPKFQLLYHFSNLHLEVLGYEDFFLSFFLLSSKHSCTERTLQFSKSIIICTIRWYNQSHVISNKNICAC